MSGALAAAIAIVALPRVHAMRRRRADPPDEDAVPDFVSLLSLAIESGMSLAAALSWAGPLAHPGLREAIRGVLRDARLPGLAEGLRRATGPGASVFHRLARAVETGAALGPSLDRERDEIEAATRARAEARAQRLPVLLLFPLTLLMLPGLILMIAGPALVEVAARFTNP